MKKVKPNPRGVGVSPKFKVSGEEELNVEGEGAKV